MIASPFFNLRDSCIKSIYVWLLSAGLSGCFFASVPPPRASGDLSGDLARRWYEHRSDYPRPQPPYHWPYSPYPPPYCTPYNGCEPYENWDYYRWQYQLPYRYSYYYPNPSADNPVYPSARDTVPGSSHPSSYPSYDPAADNPTYPSYIPSDGFSQPLFGR